MHLYLNVFNTQVGRHGGRAGVGELGGRLRLPPRGIFFSIFGVLIWLIDMCVRGGCGDMEDNMYGRCLPREPPDGNPTHLQ